MVKPLLEPDGQNVGLFDTSWFLTGFFIVKLVLRFFSVLKKTYVFA